MFLYHNKLALLSSKVNSVIYAGLHISKCLEHYLTNSPGYSDRGSLNKPEIYY